MTHLAHCPFRLLRVTSSDAVLWMLTLTGAGKDRFRGVHHFTQVGTEPEEPKQHEDEHDEDFPDDELEEVAGINKFIPELQFLWDSEEEARLKKEYAEEEAATVEGLDDYTDYGVTLPEAVIEEMKRHPDHATTRPSWGMARRSWRLSKILVSSLIVRYAPIAHRRTADGSRRRLRHWEHAAFPSNSGYRWGIS